MFSYNQFLAAGFLFESVRNNGQPLGPTEAADIKREGFEGKDPDKLAETIVAGLLNNVITDHKGMAYWALSKRFDRNLIPFFRNALRKELEENSDCVFQVMIALSNMDEPVFGGRKSLNSTETEINHRDAEGYLTKLGL